MSQFISLLIPKTMNLERLHDIGLENNLIFSPQNMLFIAEEVNDGNLQCFLAEWRENQYGFAIGEKEGGEVFCPEKEILILLGMSKKEWLEKEKQSRQEKKCEEEKKRAYLQKVLNEIRCQNPGERIGFCLHTYCGQIVGEKVEIYQTVNLKCVRGEVQLPINIEEDILYWG